MNEPDLYAAAAQLIPVLFLAILFELRLIAPFLRQLMDNEIKLGLYHEAERLQRANPRRHLLESRLFDMSTSHVNLKNHRTNWAPYEFYLHTAQVVDRRDWMTEVRYYMHQRRKSSLAVYAPMMLGLVSMLACVAALSFNTPPAIFAAFVLPGVVGLLLLFCSMFVGIVRAQSKAAKKAAWDVLNRTVGRAALGERPEKYVALEREETNREIVLREFLGQGSAPRPAPEASGQ